MIDPKITKDLDNYITYHRKIQRMKELMGGGYRMYLFQYFYKVFLLHQ